MECVFGEIACRWGIFWSPISFSLFNTCIICKGSIHIHNYLVNHRESQANPIADESIDNDIFIHDQIDHAIVSTVVHADPTRSRGRPTNDEIFYCLNCIELRDRLRQSIVNHNMHRPRK